MYYLFPLCPLQKIPFTYFQFPLCPFKKMKMFYCIPSKSLVFWPSHLNLQFTYMKSSCVYFKYLTILFINYTLLKLKKKTTVHLELIFVK